ncbi:hypothetical protein [Pseudazoarcus pumilus]|uniref:Uncharacterized protein n=1 Tax=Pseudazoarcus pumilus TaxID=2067960 RepID=A0A2I6S9C1_9RHOO|nr:hypothetical protein [Pseudazoarcus pumilus]AUN95852.1 hypothetical protein C0099_13490 [Pseudazoarcus pumilus]
MRKTPSYLKGLAETRARVAADVARLERLIAGASEQLNASRQELEACDTLIRKFDARLDPSLIQSVRGWQGRYGKRGALSEAILDYLRDCAPDAVSTPELALHLQHRFSLDFVHPKELQAWKCNTLLRRLKDFMALGLVERLHEVSDGRANKVGYWRLVGNVQNIDGLSRLAEAAGVAVVSKPLKATRRKRQPPAD